MKKGIWVAVAVILVSLIAVPAAVLGGGKVPAFVDDTVRHRNVGEAHHFPMEVIYLIAVDGMPMRTYSYGLQVPHIIEVRGYLPDVMPFNLPMLRVLWDEDGDGISEYAVEALDYTADGKVVWGDPVILRLPMASTRNFEVPIRHRL